MAIFNGRYEWDGTKTGERDPVAWFPGSYDVKIIRLAGEGKVILLRSVLCLFSQTGQGQSISANPEKFAKHLCHDFSLEFERVLWVEDLLEGENRFQVVSFVRTGKMGREYFYRPARRAATVAEARMIGRALDLLRKEENQ